MSTTLENLKHAEEVRKEALKAYNRERHTKTLERTRELKEAEVQRQEKLAASLPEMEPPTAWEVDLQARIDFIRSSGVVESNDRMVHCVEVLQREIDCLAIARKMRHKHAVDLAIAPTWPIDCGAPTSLASPDDAIFVLGRGNHHGRIGLVPSVNGERSKRLRGVGIAFLPTAWLDAGLRADIEGTRAALRQQKLNANPDYKGREMTAEREAMLETELDSDFGFIVEDDTKWDLRALAKRYYGRVTTDDMVAELSKRAACARARVGWMAMAAEHGNDLHLPETTGQSTPDAQAWWLTTTTAANPETKEAAQ